eukprot:1397178-Pyramimonas_sp.AAC.1
MTLGPRLRKQEFGTTLQVPCAAERVDGASGYNPGPRTNGPGLWAHRLGLSHGLTARAFRALRLGSELGWGV